MGSQNEMFILRAHMYIALLLTNMFCFTGIQMLSLLVPALIHFLIDTELIKYDNTSKFRCKLHELSLQCLLKIGPIYPNVLLLFTTIIY